MPSWEELEEKCRNMGGELEPLPCHWYNHYCDEDEGSECVYHTQPIFVEHDDEGHHAYCCKPQGAGSRG